MFKSIKKRLKNQRGLTLVELLAVVVILGIIAAIAVPNIGGLIDKTKQDAKIAEGVQIIQSAKLYSTSTNINFGTDDSTTTTVDESTFEILDKVQLANYLDNISDDNYQVKVSKSGKKYVYTLQSHNSIAAYNAKYTATTKTELTEKELLEY
jgi:type IV pilus assembly protein PilA